MSLRVHLTEPGAPVEPGGEGVAAVTVVNTSPIVRAYRLDLVGAAGWAFVDPRELRLFPEQAGDALVHFRPPQSPKVTAGAHGFAVKVTPTDEGASAPAGDSVVEEGTVTVAPWCAAQLAVRPKTARGSRKAKYRLVLTNSGNTRQRFDLAAADEDEMLELKLQHDELALDPGETRAVPMMARTYGRVARGERLPFTATVEGPGLTPSSANGALAISPALGPWLLRAAIALLALALVVGGFLLTRNDDPKTSAGNAAIKETTTVLQPGIATPTTTLAPGDPGTTPPAAPASPGDPAAPPPGATPSPAAPAPGAPPVAAPPPAAPPPGVPAQTTAASAPTTVAPPVLSMVTIAPILILPVITIPKPPAPVASKTTGGVSMPGTAAYLVQQMTIPAGNWTVYAKVTAVNPGSFGDFVRCHLWNQSTGTVLDGSTDTVGPAGVTRVIQNIALVSSTGSSLIMQRCSHDSASVTGIYLDAGASLVAFASQSAGDRVSKASTAGINVGTDTSIATISVTAGTWLLGFKANAVNFGGTANMGCRTNVSPAASQTVTTGGGASVMTLSGLTMISGPATVSLLCSGPAGTYMDPGSTIWAYKVSGGTRTDGACGPFANATAQLLVVVHGTCTQPPAQTRYANIMTRVYLGLGTWVWLGAETVGANPNGDFVRCGSSLDNYTTVGATSTAPGRWVSNGMGSLVTVTAADYNLDVKCAGDQQSSLAQGTNIFLKLG